MEKRSDTFVKKFSGRFLAWFKQNIGILIGLAALMAIVSLFSESFFTASNMWNILRQISTNALLAFGMTFVILIGGIDLSVGPLLAFSGVFAAYVMGNLGWPIWAAIAGSIILCSMVGMLNGVIVTKTGIAPFVVTLSVQQIFRGFAMLLANGAPIRIRDQGFINIGTTYIGPVAFPVIYMIIIMALCYVVLNKTQFGRHIYALGGNKTAARFAGIRTQRIEVMVYALSGFLAGIAGIVLAARMTAGVPATGDGYECDAIAAVVLGRRQFHRRHRHHRRHHRRRAGHQRTQRRHDDDGRFLVLAAGHPRCGHRGGGRDRPVAGQLAEEDRLAASQSVRGKNDERNRTATHCQ